MCIATFRALHTMSVLFAAKYIANACCRRFLGNHPLLSCVGVVLGFDVVLLKAGGHRQGLCLNRWNGVGPATVSLDHRARACYLLYGLLYNELLLRLSGNIAKFK